VIVIVGLVVLIAAVIVGFTGVLTNAGPAHPLTENFAVFGYHVTGSTGTLFLVGIVIGAVAMLGLCALRAVLAGPLNYVGVNPKVTRLQPAATQLATPTIQFQPMCSIDLLNQSKEST
jgi:hypothetical protein